MKITSITIGGGEWVTKAQLAKTRIAQSSGGTLGTATVVVDDIHEDLLAAGSDDDLTDAGWTISGAVVTATTVEDDNPSA